MNCTCSGSVGRPPGRLVWLKDNTPIKVGTYGDVSLMLTMAVNRTDDGDVLRCDVDWITRTEGSPYILSIACEFVCMTGRDLCTGMHIKVQLLRLIDVGYIV